MTSADPVIASVLTGTLATRYPRTVGRNARLGSHGAGSPTPIVVLRTDDGRSGWAVSEGGADPDGLVGKALSELIGPDGIRDAAHHPFDLALHDLLGVVTDTPVAALLGGSPGPVPVYDGAIYFDDLDPDDSPHGLAQLLRECRDDAELGFTAFKLKIGRGNRWMATDIGDRRDIEVTRAIRTAFPDATIMVDGNDGYDLERMGRYASEVADVGLFWIEEPFADDHDDLLALRSHLDEVSPTTLIADGEFHPDVPTLLPTAAAGGLQVLLMDVCGYGVTPWRAIMPQVRDAGAQISPHAWGRPLKTWYAAHLARGLGSAPTVEGVPGTTTGVAAEDVRVVDGVLTLTDRPGFGLPVPDLSLVQPR